MKKLICSICEGKENHPSWEWPVFEGFKVPEYGSASILWRDLELCAFCLSKIFQKKWIQNALKRERRDEP